MEITLSNNNLSNKCKHILEISNKSLIKDFIYNSRINIEINSKFIIFSAFNGRIIGKAKIELSDFNGSLIKDGSCSVVGNDFFNILKSFLPNERLKIKLIENSSAKELRIEKESDAEEYQTIPCFNELMEFPEEAKIYSKEITVKKDILNKCIESVSFAVGFEEKEEKYLYWVLRFAKNKLRAVASIGNRFAVYECNGSELHSCDSAFNLLVPKDANGVLKSLISLSDDNDVSIKKSDGKATGLFQLKFETKNCEFLIGNMSPNIQWPDENVILNLEQENKIVVSLDDLKYAADGSALTFNGSVLNQNKTYIVDFEVDKSKNTVIIQSNELMKSNRKISIKDSSLKDSYKFRIYSKFIKEIVDRGYNGNIQIEYSNSGKQIFVIYFNSSDKIADKNSIFGVNTELSIKEKFCMFFSCVKNN